jgi:tetratricopeptide (TPR) repeat protein
MRSLERTFLLFAFSIWLLSSCAATNGQKETSEYKGIDITKRQTLPDMFNVPEVGKVKPTQIKTVLDEPIPEIQAPKDPIEAAKLAKQYADAGVKAYAAGNLDETIRCFQKALKVTPDWTQVRFDLGFVLYLRGNDYSVLSHQEWQRAKGFEYDELTKKWFPVEKTQEQKTRHLANSFGYYYFGMVKFMRRAIDEWSIVAARRPEEARTIYYMGFAYMMLEEYNNAKRCWQAVLDNVSVREDIKERVREALSILEKFEEKRRAEGAVPKKEEGKIWDKDLVPPK